MTVRVTVQQAGPAQPGPPAPPAHAWIAPRAHGPISGTVRVPGSKSQTNRELVLAALANGPSRISDGLRSRDTDLMIAGLQAMGTQIDVADHSWLVTPRSFIGANIDTGLAGTVMRFLPPVAALAHGAVHFDGDLYARERPMRALIEALRQAGATVDDAGAGRLPLTVHGVGQVAGGLVHVDASASSQFVSALLLAGARFDAGIEIAHVGTSSVPSAPHIAMTLQALRDRGVHAAATSDTSWRAGPGPIAARDVAIEPDLSNAAPFLAAAVITGGSVTVPGWPTTTTQAGDSIRALLAQFGAQVSFDTAGLTVTGTGVIRGIDVDLRDISELVTVVAVLAAVANSPSHLTGLAHTRGHETDRLAALHTQLSRIGCHVIEHTDGLTIDPRPLHGGLWQAYADHRMATAGALIGLVVDDIKVDDIACTSKTLPNFVDMWTGLLS